MTDQPTLTPPPRQERPPGVRSGRNLARQQAELVGRLACLLSGVLRRLRWADLPPADRRAVGCALRSLEHDVQLACLAAWTPPVLPPAANVAF